MDDLPHPHRIETAAARALRDGVAHGRRLERRIPCGRIRLAHGGRHRGLARARRLDRRAAHRPVLIRPARIAPPSASLHSPGNRTAMPVPSQLLFLPGASGSTAFWQPLAGLLTHPAERRIVGYPASATRARSGRRRFRQPRASCAGNDRPADRRDRAIDGGVIAMRAALDKPALITHLVLTVTSGGSMAGASARRTGAPVSREANPQLPTGS